MSTRSYGAKLDDPGKHRFAAVRIEHDDTPDSVDYMYGFNIPDQGELGVCVGEGWCKEFNFIATKRAKRPFSVSARAIFAAARAATDAGDTTDSGLTVSSGGTVLEQGYVDESDWPSTDVASEDDFPSWLELPPPAIHRTDFTLKGIVRLAEISPQQLELALDKNGALVFGGNWLDSWENIAGDTLEEAMLPVDGTAIGGHCFNGVGYKRDTTVPGGGYVYIANSWGKEWGWRGFAALPYAAIANLTDVYTIQA